MSMWDNDAPTRAPLTRGAPAATDGVGACATCEQPAPPSALRCDACVNAAFDRLRATHGEAWHDAHTHGRRGEVGEVGYAEP